MAQSNSSDAMKRAELAALRRQLPSLSRQRWGGKGDKDTHDAPNPEAARAEARIKQLQREIG
jgi:hypothetical protein